MIKIKQGLDIPIAGSPGDKISDSKKTRSVGLIGADYIGLKSSLLVKQGEKVKLGQPILLDKSNPGIIFTSPAGGVVQSINRGLRRVLQSIVIDVDDEEEEITFESFSDKELESLDTNQVRERLIQSGLWASFKTRPFSKIPTIKENPSAIFVNAMDTHPLSIDPEIIISLKKDAFKKGINILKLVTDNPIHICVSESSSVDIEDDNQIYKHFFSGPHPSGLSGTHMHFISPSSILNVNWFLNYSDVIAFGDFFDSGKIPTERYVSLGGPQVIEPKIFLTRVGACTDELCAGEIKKADNRIISGSVISGREAIGPFSYLGRYHNQISVIQEAAPSDRELFDWMQLGFNRYSKLPLFISNLVKNKKYNLKTLMYGPDRAILPIGVYEQVFPLHMLITMLLRYIAIGDTEKLQLLGALELDEEDLALCSFVCPSKYDFGSLLRENLTRIETEG